MTPECGCSIGRVKAALLADNHHKEYRRLRDVQRSRRRWWIGYLSLIALAVWLTWWTSPCRDKSHIWPRPIEEPANSVEQSIPDYEAPEPQDLPLLYRATM
jgi:hypothetical protein